MEDSWEEGMSGRRETRKEGLLCSKQLVMAVRIKMVAVDMGLEHLYLLMDCIWEVRKRTKNGSKFLWS